ncbi:hypothetical protein POTOM_051403 [Populus tomentosa]|uniref:Phorbol-ester/DAG-type domain-containing protein n=1 Tax=Populus tomentosa TaxID=118781 RepID=A0A8X7Y715_POPTO|nr:hypothetical protein POTOM_051403 [Populus tomentosa]
MRSSGAFILDTLSIYWQSHHMKENTFVIGAPKLSTVLFTIVQFDLDIKCAFPPGFFEVDSQFAHKDHPLILNEEQEYLGEGVMCSLCKEPMSGPSYSCTSCNFFLHKKCAELPPEIKRHIHPEHPLLDQDQGHQFRSLLNPRSFKSISFTCNACGTNGYGSPFMCTMCQLVVHEECISLPLTLKTALHHHPRIIHTYQLQQCIESINKDCGICYREVDTEYGVYYCPDCDFVAHVNCSREYDDSATGTGGENEEERSVTVDDQFMEPSFCVVREIKHGKERIIEEIEHFSHQHNLILTDKVDDDLNRGEHHLYKCSVCKQYFSGLSYCCVICALCIDVRCFKSLKDSLKHGGHDEHPLYLPAGRKSILRCNIGGCGAPPWVADDGEIIPHCSGCCVTEESKVFLKCAVCDFKLGMKCATLPYKARHEYDEHPLFLTYINENDYQPSCIICERYRDPKLWFYRCEECDFDAHPECALGKHPYFKSGEVLTYPKHPHPIALVVKTEDYAACDTCGEPCDDLALECTDPNCSFIVHGYRMQCFMSLIR